jgi:hypothetical protein
MQLCKTSTGNSSGPCIGFPGHGVLGPAGGVEATAVAVGGAPKGGVAALAIEHGGDDGSHAARRSIAYREETSGSACLISSS